MVSVTTNSKSLQLTVVVPTVVAIVGMLVCAVDFYVVGGLPHVLTFRRIVSFTLPFTVIATTLMVCRIHLNNIRRKATRIEREVAFFGSLLATIIPGLAYGSVSLPFRWIYDIFVISGTASITGAVGICAISAFFRVYTAKTPTKLWLIIVTLLGLMACSVLGGAFPLSYAINEWISFNIAVVANAVIWTGFNLGLMALIARIIVFKEKVRV